MISVSGVEEVERKLKQLSTVADKKLLYKLANRVLSGSRKRITAQRDLTGTAWKGRSENTDEKKKRKKMMTGLRKRMRVLSVTDTQAVIGFSGLALKIATEQQQGKRIKITQSQQRARANLTAKATKRQAAQMIALGFTLSSKKPSIKKITDRYTIGQAGWIIKRLKAAKGISSQAQWDVILPARSWLGINSEDEKSLLDLINQELNKTLGT